MPIEPFGMAKVDSKGECIFIENVTDAVRIDGMLVFKIKVTTDGQVYLQFADCERARNKHRGTRFIEVPATILFEKIISSSA